MIGLLYFSLGLIQPVSNSQKHFLGHGLSDPQVTPNIGNKIGLVFTHTQHKKGKERTRGLELPLVLTSLASL
jgi:hypothetical protein